MANPNHQSVPQVNSPSVSQNCRTHFDIKSDKFITPLGTKIHNFAIEYISTVIYNNNTKRAARKYLYGELTCHY